MGNRERRSSHSKRSSRKKKSRRSHRSKTPTKKRRKKSSLWDVGPSNISNNNDRTTLPTMRPPTTLISKINPYNSAASITKVNSRIFKPNLIQVKQQSKRLYIGNLPPKIQSQHLKNFLNLSMNELQGEKRNPGDSIINVFINNQKCFAFAEFRTANEANKALNLDGINFQGTSLKIGKPINYDSTSLTEETKQFLISSGDVNMNNENFVEKHVPDGPNKLFCKGLPPELSDKEVMELLSTYGTLKAFHLAKDSSTGLSKGMCYFIYNNISVTKDAVKGLNDIKIGEHLITVQFHKSPTSLLAEKQAIKKKSRIIVKPKEEEKSNLIIHEIKNMDVPPSNILCMLSMVTLTDLNSNIMFNEIFNDIYDECKNYGKVKSLIIPRPDVTKEVKGIGKVFVEFDSIKSAKYAKFSLEGRTFDNRPVLIRFCDPKDFNKGKYDKL